MTWNIEPEKKPEWQQPSESVLEQVQRLSRSIRALDPKNWVYVYSDAVEENQVIVMNEAVTDDGKRHVFLNPKHRQQIDQFLATVDTDTV